MLSLLCSIETAAAAAAGWIIGKERVGSAAVDALLIVGCGGASPEVRFHELRVHNFPPNVDPTSPSTPAVALLPARRHRRRRTCPPLQQPNRCRLVNTEILRGGTTVDSLHACSSDDLFRESPAHHSREEDHPERGRFVLALVRPRHILGERKSDGPSKPCEPNDELHRERDLHRSSEVGDERDGKRVEEARDQTEEDGHEDEGGRPVAKAARENTHSHEQEHERLRHVCHGVKNDIGRVLGHFRKIVRVVVCEDDAAEKEGHDPTQLHRLSHGIGPVGE
mmetsp:Transcript_1546/g.3115  ORF Transcript_1546/g.3115 Transcript_1546/m.3115 type:complete len:280 (-) Transcript_1546:547-1386(-)